MTDLNGAPTVGMLSRHLGVWNRPEQLFKENEKLLDVLNNMTVNIDDNRTYYGRYWNKPDPGYITISMSTLKDKDFAGETLLHEIAHAVVMYVWQETGHSTRWAAIAEALGVVPTAKIPFELVPAIVAERRMEGQRPVLRCPNCGHVYNRLRGFDKRKAYNCHKCDSRCEHVS